MSIQSIFVRHRGRLLIVVGLTLIPLRPGASVFGQTPRFTNPTAIVIPGIEPVAPYPSTVSVAKLAGEIASISVTVSNLTHSTPEDLDLLLAGPNGQAVLLMSDAGGDAHISNVTLTFSDRSSLKLPDSAQIRSGTYAPSSFARSDLLPAPATAGPYGGDLSIFHGTDPNGDWRLFVHNESAKTRGAIASGWVLELGLSDRPPAIIRQPQSQAVSPGMDVTLEVGVTGTPPFGYQWLRNGRILVPFGQGAARLTLANLQAADAGTYNVVVTNRARPIPGVTSHDAVLNVTGRLTLVEPLRDQIVSAGESVILYAAASGTPPLYYQWHLNGAVLPGETNSTLTLGKLQATDGGNYSVLIHNDKETLRSTPAQLNIPASTAPPPTDQFRDRPRLGEMRGTLQGDSSLARGDPNEPVTAGGGKSVWFEWTAPADGIVSMSTRGSTFDTLLAVFVGDDLQNLAPVASDDDGGGFYTSSLQFNARRGMAYQVALDGFGVGGAGDHFTLSWELETTDQRVPIIASNASSQAVPPGGSTTLRVITGSARDDYQWFLNSQPIPGATNSAYTVTNAASSDVGLYSARVSNEWGRSIVSPPVQVQLNSGNLALVQDKYDGMFRPSANGNRPTQGFIAIGLGGVVLTNEFYSLANRHAGDPDPCGEPFFGTLWLGLTATNHGLIQVETTGSQIPARLAVYKLTGGANDFDTNAIVCDLESGPAGRPCVARFEALQGTNYTVVVEGFQATGNLSLISRMGVAAPITEEPRCLRIIPGRDLLLDVPAASWFPTPAYQWRLNGRDIPSATSPTLFIQNFNEAFSGAYSVLISNFVGIATQTVAHVAVGGLIVLNHAVVRHEGSLSLVINASAEQSLVLEMASALEAVWSPVLTNNDACATLTFTNSNILLAPRRFYRATRWPMLEF